MNLTLYKNNRFWTIQVDGDDIIKSYGVIGGKTTTKRTKSRPKNVGKKNETTGPEQAMKEARSLVNKKVDEGYSAEGEQPSSFRPMLAHEYEKNKDKMPKWVIVQPKLDGIRMCAYLDDRGEVTITSRNAKVVPGMATIRESLEHILKEGIVLDGEFYAHGTPFQTITSIFKRGDKNGLGEFHVFDYFDKNDPDLSTMQRLKRLQTMLENAPVNISFVRTAFTAMNSDAHEFMHFFIKEGWEGAMIRDPSAKYLVDGRSYGLLKLKNMQTDEYEITDAKEDITGNLQWICKTKDEKTFKVNPKGTRTEFDRELIKNNIGKMLTVQFQELTTNGIPRFPVGIEIRDYD